MSSLWTPGAALGALSLMLSIVSDHASARPILDHVAVGVRQWSDAYPRFVGELGGLWSSGGPSGDFAYFQLEYGTGVRLEFLSPYVPGGFMERFIARHGPAAHHLTFKVASLEETVCRLRAMGLDPFPGRDEPPLWRESFVHPKEAGIGTLVQFAETDDGLLDADDAAAARPRAMPEPPPEVRRCPLSLLGVTCPDLGRARAVLVDVLGGSVREQGEGWFVVSWGPARSLLARREDVTPGGRGLWAAGPRAGVAFLVFGHDVSVTALTSSPDGLVALPHDDATGVTVWRYGPVGSTDA